MMNEQFYPDDVIYVDQPDGFRHTKGVVISCENGIVKGKEFEMKGAGFVGEFQAPAHLVQLVHRPVANAEIARLNEVIDSRNRIVDELCAITGEIWPPHALDRVTHMKSELQRQAAKLMTSGFDTAALPVKSTGMEVWRSMAMRYSIALEDIADGATNPVELATKALQKE
jgi:hypothetical protein